MNINSKKISILDCTLREGEQAKNILFSLEEKIYIANLLKSYGVNQIEIGHPGISEEERLICQQICESISEAEFLVHARALVKDIIAAHSTGARWVGIWVSCNEIALENKFTNKTLVWIFEQVESAIRLAKTLGMNVRLTIEDASRTVEKTIFEIVSVALKAGADRISLADTVGAWSPHACHAIVKSVVEQFSCEVEVHLHNDLGLAMANAVAAMDAGATIIDTSVLGIGERAGICDLFSVTTYLNKFHEQCYDFSLTKKLSNAIERIGCFSAEPHHPLVGKNVFTHVAKYHVKATEKNVEAYQFLDPALFSQTISFSPKNLERKSTQRINNSLQVKQPFVKGASELLYHRDGIGTRWVCMDNRIDPRSSLYVIERIFDKEDQSYQPHVDTHAHHCDSVFVFMGDSENGVGLTAKVTFGEGETAETQLVHSPASVFIPAGVKHTYEYVKGNGRFLNIVLASNYNDSLV